MNYWLALGMAVLGYLIGSIPFALIIGKLFYHKDIRDYGSHNLGGTNAGRVLGPKIGVLTIALDILKCTIPMVIVELTLGYNYALIMGVLIPFGHCWPFFAEFKGGKAVASSIGFILGSLLLKPYELMFVLFVPLIIMLIIVKTTKYVSLGSLVMYGCSFIISLFFNNYYLSIAYLILWILIIYRHRENIKRLLNHTENKITW